MTKATRRLSEFNFGEEGAHVALVGKHQGGPANGITTLITKATNTITQEQIEKAATVTVEMQFPEFLRKFFGMYWDDSEVLSAAMGYGRTEYPDTEVKDWIDQRVESISIMKSVYRAQDVEKALAALTPDQTLALMKDQEMLEKALGTVPETTLPQEEQNMETISKAAHVEFVAEAVSVVQKSLDAQTEVLKSVQAELEVFKSAAADAVVASRTAALAAVLPAAQVEAIVKATAVLGDEAFAAIVAGYTVEKAVDKDLLDESGVSGTGEADAVQVDRTQEILKARYGIKN